MRPSKSTFTNSLAYIDEIYKESKELNNKRESEAPQYSLTQPTEIVTEYNNDESLLWNLFTLHKQETFPHEPPQNDNEIEIKYNVTFENDLGVVLFDTGKYLQFNPMPPPSFCEFLLAEPPENTPIIEQASISLCSECHITLCLNFFVPFHMVKYFVGIKRSLERLYTCDSGSSDQSTKKRPRKFF